MANRTNSLIIFLLLLGIAFFAVPQNTLALEPDRLISPPPIEERPESNFSIEADDQEILSGQVYFILSSVSALRDQPIVFFLSIDGSIVRQVSLVALSTSGKHWQVAFDTKQISNGTYHLVVGSLRTDFTLEIWHDAGWKQVFNNTDINNEKAPIKILTLPTSTPPQILELSPATSTLPDDVVPRVDTVVVPTSTVEIVASTLPTVTKYCQDQGILEAAQCSTLELTRRYPECRSAHIWQIDECQKYLGRIYFAQACEPEHITNPNQCQQYWQQAAGEHLSCVLPQAQCLDITSQHVGELAAHWIVSEKAQAVITGLINRPITFKTLQQGLSSHGIATDSTVIQSYGFEERPGLKLLPAESAITVEADGAVVSSWPAVMLIDSDADGLTDDAEVRYGTKKDQSDTDGDSYLDGDEVQHSFSPLGSGALVASLETVDQLQFSQLTWQQPLRSGDRDQHLIITDIKPFANGKGTIISGQAQTLQTVTLFIYGSQVPLVASARADDQGNWAYYLAHPLVDGRYTIYATQMTKEGLVLGKSEARTMYLRHNQPVTPLAFTQEQPRVLGVDFISLPTSPLLLMIIAGVIVCGFLLFFVGWLVSRKAR